MSNALKRKLREENIAITDNAANARSFMRIEQSNSSARELSISYDGRTAEKMHSISARIEWRSKDIQLLDNVITTEAVQSANPENQAAHQAESELIAGEMQQQLVATALQRIRHAIGNSAPQSTQKP